MSYEIVKSVGMFRNKNQIMVTSACNNCRPLTYERWEYDKDEPNFDKKIIHLFVDMLAGNLQPYKSCRNIYNTLQECFRYYSIVRSRYDLIHVDYTYKTNFTEEIEMFIATGYALPVVNKMQVSNQYMMDSMNNYVKKIEKTIKEKVKEYHEKGIIIVKSASFSNIISGYDVFTDEKKNIIIAPQKNYHNDGLLDNSRNEAICLTSDTSTEAMLIRNMLSFDGYGDKTRDEVIKRYAQNSNSKKEIIEKLFSKCELSVNDCLRAVGLKMSKLPYVGYPAV